MNKYKFIKSVILVLIISTFLVGGWFLFFKYVKGMEEEIISTKKEISENENRINNVQTLERLLNDFSEEEETLNSAILAEDDLVEFIEFLEDLAQRSKIGLSISSASLPESTKKRKSAPASFANPVFEIKASGSFDDLMRYLILLENSPFQVSFQRINIQALGSTQQTFLETEEDWQAIFKINVLSYM